MRLREGLATVDASIAGARRQLTQQFRMCGLETPDLDARVLISYVLGLDHAALAAQADRALTAAEARAITALGARRLEHEPVARIIGEKEFWGLVFKLNAETLVPRPESETVVEAALAALDRAGGRTRSLRLADLGTGTGALLLALLSELPNASGVGTDLSAGALACARDNADVLGLSERASFVACDYASALTGRFDLVVCNPPYVAHGDIASLQPEVRLFDPPLALDGGADGLDGYRAIAADARRLLAPDGRLVVELGAGQEDAVATLFAARGLAATAAHKDLAGIARALAVKLLP